MRKTTRDEELSFVVFAQLHTEPLAIGLAAFAQVKRTLQYAADCAAYEFGLAVRRTLEMQTAYYTIGRARLIVLHKLRVNTCGAIPLLIIRLYEIAACIFEYLRFNDQ